MAISDKISSAVNSILGKNKQHTTAVIIVIVAIVIIMTIMLYIAYAIRSASYKSKILFKGEKNIKKQSHVFESTSMPKPASSIEYSFSFWLYISDISNDPTGYHKLIMYRGNTDDTSEPGQLPRKDQNDNLANPIVFMHKTTNRLYVSFAKRENKLNKSRASSLDDLIPESKNYPKSGYITIPVEYFPLQRWVSVGMTIQQNLVTLYINGRIYSVKSVNDKDVSERDLFQTTTGNLKLGMENQISPNIYVSRLRFFNYSVSQSDMYHIFTKGPTQFSLWKMLGYEESPIADFLGYRVTIKKITKDTN